MKILFRKALADEDEFDIASKYCNITTTRELCKDELVVGRYSVLPYYKEQEEGLKQNNCTLVNSFRQHNWIAKFEYYEQLKDYTFETWDDYSICYCKYDGPFVVKGRTNSRKSKWNTLMYAKDKSTAFKIGSELSNDPIIGEQGLIYRKYVPLETFEIGINGQPFTNEWRLFYYKGKLLSYGYYWSQAEDANSHYLSLKGIEFADEVANIAKDYTNFFVLDIARTEKGDWILVEVNDGQMSGLSMCNPHELYRNLNLVV